MSPPSENLAPPKVRIASTLLLTLQARSRPQDDPISPSALSAYDGSDPSKPIYVAIKGRVFDVTPKKEMYGKGQGYNVFAGRDASKGLGMSSLDPKDAVPDYSGLNEAQMKTLDQWESFFEKVSGGATGRGGRALRGKERVSADAEQRYNIVGRVGK